MPGADTTTPPQNPQAEYAQRLEALRARESEYERRHRRLGSTNLGVLAVAAVVVIVALAFRSLSILWVLVPAAVFAALATRHAGVLSSLRKCRRVIAFYERGLARLADQWMGAGEHGGRFLDPNHPYARDLDLFGPGSLFELLCTARTPVGEQTLADWLLHAASPAEIHARQAAVNELRGRLDLREDLAVLGEDVRRVVRPDALVAWGEAEAVLKPGPMRVVLALLALVWVASLAAWAVWGRFDLALLSSAVNVAVGYRFRKRARRVAPAVSIHSATEEPEAAPAALSVEGVAPELEVLAGVLARLERERFSCAKLVELQAALHVDGKVPSRAVARLSRLVEYVESRRNMFVGVADPFVFWTLQCAFAVETWRRTFGPALRRWLAAVGEIEALSALAGYAYEHPADVFPEFTEESPRFEAEGFAHPLLPESRAVRNDLQLGRELRLLVISGPNMAGKSTLIRAVGINAVLAQCGAPVRARRLRLSPLAVAASICVLDSLQGGVSRFYAEITRLKLIADLAGGPQPALFLLDELLNGTNSHDRRVGAEAVVHSLVGRGAIGLITTHDLALAQVADDAALRAANFHFADHLENGELRFDYRLSPGVVQTTNALKLMRSIGLEV
ncbi:MAG TPA: DNA mismatch repair protein MutS [Terriglobia bacterium]|nr:DNA mismatch repair protein MutS [Terriglobia bacterium]